MTLDSISVNGTIVESGVELNLFDITDITKSSAKIVWEINNPEIVSRMELSTNNNEWQEINPELGSYQLSGLQSNSKYSVYINMYTNDGKAKKIGKEFTTQSGPEIPTENKLVGISW